MLGHVVACLLQQPPVYSLQSRSVDFISVSVFISVFISISVSIFSYNFSHGLSWSVLAVFLPESGLVAVALVVVLVVACFLMKIDAALVI